MYNSWFSNLTCTKQTSPHKLYGKQNVVSVGKQYLAEILPPKFSNSKTDHKTENHINNPHSLTSALPDTLRLNP